LTAAVRARCPAHPKAGAWWERGVVVPRGFAVWEASSPEDDRDERRIVVVAAENQDAALSAWTWVVGGDRSLPRFGQYLLHAAKLRYQRRIWWSAERGFRQARQEADKTVQKLLALVAPQQPQPRRREPSQAELVAASRELVSLQAGELGLVQTSTSLREMHRTVDIASANLTALSENGQLDGLFADDRSLAAWFGQQLDDDATYLEAARERVTQVGGLTDQLVQRVQQRRQERFNLGLTGVIGAILMVLAAIQSLQYTVPLPPLVKPAVITTLGAAALLASLVVLRFAVSDRRWPLALVWVGFGATTAAATWIGVSAFAGATTVAGTWLWAGAGFVVGVAAAVLVTPV
jgi:CASPASE and TPR Repeat-associated protein